MYAIHVPTVHLDILWTGCGQAVDSLRITSYCGQNGMFVNIQWHMRKLFLPGFLPGTRGLQECFDVIKRLFIEHFAFSGHL